MNELLTEQDESCQETDAALIFEDGTVLSVQFIPFELLED